MQSPIYIDCGTLRPPRLLNPHIHDPKGFPVAREASLLIYRSTIQRGTSDLESILIEASEQKVVEGRCATSLSASSA